MTARDLINGSLRLINVLAKGETISSDDAQDALYSLNSLIESWGISGFMVYGQTTESFDLVAPKNKYIMGSDISNDLVSKVPLTINNATIEVNGSEIPLRIVNEVEWSQVQNKSTTSNIPSIMFFNRFEDKAELFFWPVPQSNFKLNIYSKKSLVSINSINQTLLMPPGHERALRYNLAIELAPEYGKEPSILVIETANETKNSISLLNQSTIMMKADVMPLVSNSGGFDINKG